MNNFSVFCNQAWLLPSKSIFFISYKCSSLTTRIGKQVETKFGRIDNIVFFDIFATHFRLHILLEAGRIWITVTQDLTFQLMAAGAKQVEADEGKKPFISPDNSVVVDRTRKSKVVAVVSQVTSLSFLKLILFEKRRWNTFFIFGVVYKWRHGLRRGEVNDFLTSVLEP